MECKIIYTLIFFFNLFFCNTTSRKWCFKQYSEEPKFLTGIITNQHFLVQNILKRWIYTQQWKEGDDKAWLALGFLAKFSLITMTTK